MGSPAQAKALVQKELDKMGFSYDRLSAKTVGFSDLARESFVFVTVHGAQPGRAPEDYEKIEKMAKEQGFGVDFKFGDKRAAKASGHHIAVYNDKIVPVEMDNPKDEFKYAARRVVDNAPKGFVVTPKGEVFAVSTSFRMAKPVVGPEKDAVLATVGMGAAVEDRVEGTLRERTALAPTAPRRKVPSKDEHRRLGKFIADLVAKKTRPNAIAAMVKAAFPRAAWDFGRVAGEANEAFERITGTDYAGSGFEPQHLFDAVDAAEDAMRLKTMYERWRDKEVRVEVWEERGSIHIGIQDEEDPHGAYIVSWWDDEARSMFDDGFFKSGRDLEQSVVNYADEHGIFPYATGKNEDIQERVATLRKPKASPAADPTAEPAAPDAPDRSAMASALSALAMAETQMEKFISRADDPMGPMEAVGKAAGEVAERAKRGEPISARDLGQVGTEVDALARTFGAVYGPFAEAREMVYRAAKALDISTRRTGAKKETPPPLEGKKPRDLAGEVEGIGKDFHKAFRDVQEKSAKALNAARRAQDAGTEDSVKAAVEAFLDFRDAVGPGYYAMLNGVIRRTDELFSRMGRSRVREIPGEPPEAPTHTPSLAYL